MQLLDHGGLTDTRVTRDEGEPRCAVRRHGVEGGKQERTLRFASVELVGNRQSIGCVTCRERKGFEPTSKLPIVETSMKIDLEAAGRLIAILGVLGEELQEDRLQCTGDALHSLARGRGWPGDVAVNPLERIRRREGQRSGEHLVEGDPQRIKIAASVERAIHAPGLLRRHVSERSGNHLPRRRRSLRFMRQSRGNAEAGQSDAILDVDEDVRRLDVPVNETSPVHLAHRRRDADRDTQESRETERGRRMGLQRVAAEILQRSESPVPRDGS